MCSKWQVSQVAESQKDGLVHWNITTSTMSDAQVRPKKWRIYFNMTKGSMRDVLQLEDLPDITPDSDDLNHMRVQELVSCRH